MSRTRFPHERLDAWRLACEARALAFAFTATLPRGFGDESRQINNAAGSVVRNLCEGANRWAPAEKILKFEIANGEAGEAAGTVASLLAMQLGEAEVGNAFIERIDRTASCLVGLIRQQRAR